MAYFPGALRLAGAGLGIMACLASPAGATEAPVAKTAPVYVHMNGANMFLESVVAVRPGQAVVFVNEDTGAHTVIGFNPATGVTDKRFDGALPGTPGPGHSVHTYSVRFKHGGLKYYYCSVHAELAREPGGVTVAKKRATVHGFCDPMSGLIIVTTDKVLLRANPRSSTMEILQGYFGG